MLPNSPEQRRIGIALVSFTTLMGGLEVKCGVIMKAAASKIIKFRLLLFR
jgi:hypothetical protein